MAAEVEPVVVATVHVACPECDAHLPVPIVVSVYPHGIYAKPDMADVWAHSFAHGVVPAVVPDGRRTWVIPHVDFLAALGRAGAGESPELILDELSQLSHREWVDGDECS